MAFLTRPKTPPRHHAGFLAFHPATSFEETAMFNDALERFGTVDALKAKLVKLRYFAGLTIPQAVEELGISTTTWPRDFAFCLADRYWAYARAWLHAGLHRLRGQFRLTWTTVVTEGRSQCSPQSRLQSKPATAPVRNGNTAARR
ncbi:MAG TPA: ECF-type sigma factor [Gemmataceae bacterium]|nr:ECF-type sigma factor [Gemmataceae bacterium]